MDVRMTPGELGRTLRRRRVTLGLTQAEVAERARVSRQWLMRLETGHANAELAKVLEVIRVLDLVVTLTEPNLATPPPAVDDTNVDLDRFLSGFTG